MPAFDESDIAATQTSTIDEISEVKAKPKPIIRKPRKFSDKYSKGKHIGTGPFGHVYNCWVRDDLLDHFGDDGAEDETFVDDKGEKKMLTLKIFKKNLLS